MVCQEISEHGMFAFRKILSSVLDLWLYLSYICFPGFLPGEGGGG